MCCGDSAKSVQLWFAKEVRPKKVENVHLLGRKLVRTPADCGPVELRDALLAAITQPELPTHVDYVRVMSLHKSKGLTADLVIVAGAIQGCIPRIDQELSGAELQRHHEEQRRLFYVAITRPRRMLIVSSARAVPRSAAYQMGVPVRGRDPHNAITIASEFINELGETRPATVRGEELLR